MYLLALICPPLAVLLTGRIFQAGINVLFSLMVYFPGALHAILVVADHKANKRADRIAETAARGNVAVATAVQVNVVVSPPAAPIPATVAEALGDRKAKLDHFAAKLAEDRIRGERFRRAQLVRSIVEAPARTARAAAGAYRELPEWAQPVTWGLAVGAPFGIIGGLLFLTRLSGK